MVETADGPLRAVEPRSLGAIRRGMLAGASDYMVTPFQPLDLVAHVQALLRRGRS